ncbi:MAG: YciI family protein [Gaiellaceae bacterium]
MCPAEIARRILLCAVRSKLPSALLRVAVDFVAPRLSNSDHSEKEEAMKYMLLIHQGATPTPGSDEWESLSEDEKGAVYGAYKALNETPGVSPGLQLQPPETATTVRVQDGKTLTTDGPFAEIKEAIGGYLMFEADDLDAAIELASRIPAARMGGAIEVRPIVGR